jgi:hypothetical protein
MRLSYIISGNESSGSYGNAANVFSGVLETSEIFDDEKSSVSSILPGEEILNFSLLGLSIAALQEEQQWKTALRQISV